MSYKSLFLFVLMLSLSPILGCKPSSASLMTAIKADNTKEAKSLIGKGADANSRTSPSAWSALHYAARNGNAEIVQLLLKAGADPNYSGAMEGQKGTAISLKPLEIAQATQDLVNQIPASSMAETLREGGLDDPALLKSVTDPKAADRYRKVVELLTAVTKSK